MQRRLAEIQLGNGGPVLAAAADEALRTSPHLATELFDAAVCAGGSARTVTARRAQVAALAGDSARALRLADETLTAENPSPDDRRRAVEVTAAVLAHRGFPERTAELYQGLGDTDVLHTVPALLATGDLERARAVLAKAHRATRTARGAAGPRRRLPAHGRDGPTTVREAVTGLRQAGLDWDAARLAAETTDEPIAPVLSERELEVGSSSSPG